MMPSEVEEIALDLRQAARTPTGVGRYLVGLANAASEEGLRVRAYIRSDRPHGVSERVELVSIAALGPSWHLSVWRALRGTRVPYLSTSFVVAQLPRMRAVPVVLDVTTRLYPQYHAARTALAESLLLPRAIRRCPVITCTEATARDIRALYGEEVRISIVPPVLPLPRVDALSRPATPPYVLYVGTIEPRKNLVTGLRAVRALRRTGINVRLIAIGKLGWRTSDGYVELVAAMQDGAAEWRGYVSDAERDHLYAGATAVIVPSVHEGFGLPVLEAMQRGVACVCSDTPALVEVAAGAAIHVPTFDVPRWADAIARLVSSPDARLSLSQLGLRRASEFNSRATGEALLRALRAFG